MKHLFAVRGVFSLVLVVCTATVVLTVTSMLVGFNGNLQVMQQMNLDSAVTFTPTTPNPCRRQSAEKQQAELLPRKHLLLVTHGRSGSTYTADIIRAHPDVFYMFEPLKTLQDYSGLKMPLYRINELKNESEAVLKAVLSCELDAITDFPLTDLVHFSARDKSQTDCLDCFAKKTKCKTYLNCFSRMLRLCLTRPLMLVKTIRFRLDWTENMLRENSNSAILYLIRDPRAVITSQLSALINPLKLNLTQSLKIICPQLREDIGALKRLTLRYPDRVKMVRYEHGALNPLKYARDIYRFIGMDLTDNVVDFVNSITSARADDSLFGTVRASSAEAMDAWRHRVSFDEAREVDRWCSDVLPDLGYKLLTSKAELKSNSSLLLESELD
ncbi:carbohydrate sulfotransferase 1 [Aplysia californica]|uniref:Carbohydrate sulfotransferase 1 n=1 Tax=Aplysia californica TaxID=6500 RepID=A0ABM0K1K9_APLCA|nr:carbohydrate sulfotransferase 1 [Aplysia californica]